MALSLSKLLNLKGGGGGRAVGVSCENQCVSYKRQLQALSPAKPQKKTRSLGFLFFFLPSPFPDSQQCSPG